MPLTSNVSSWPTTIRVPLGIRTCVDLPTQFPEGRGREALIPDRLAPLRYEMTATASKVNASIARHSLSVPPGGTISR